MLAIAGVTHAISLRTGIMSDMAMFQQLTWPSIEMLP